MAIENGTFGILKLDGKRIALLKSAGLNLSTAMRDVSTKDSFGWKEIEPGQKSVKFNCEGLFVQKSQNLLLDTETLAEEWDRPSVSITNNSSDSPYGRRVANLITWNAGTFIQQTIPNGSIPFDTYATFSVWVKGTGSIYITLEDNDAQATSAVITLSGSWQFVSVTYLVTANFVIATIHKQTGTAVTVYGPMLNIGDNAMVYKPTGQLFMDLMAYQLANQSFELYLTNEIQDGEVFYTDLAYISDGSLKAATEDNAAFTCTMEAWNLAINTFPV